MPWLPRDSGCSLQTLCSEKRCDRRQIFNGVGASIRGRIDRLYGPCACSAGRQIALSPFISAKDVARDESYTDEQKDYSCQSDSERAISVAGRREEETNNDTREAD